MIGTVTDTGERRALRAPPQRVGRFGVFEADLQSGELRKAGLKIRIQEQPFQVLTALLERPAEVVTREELHDRLWRDTFVDFDRSLNIAVNKLRAALGDSAVNPRFVETLPRRGYRFIAPVDGAAEKTPDREGRRPEEPKRSDRVSGRRWWLAWPIAAFAALLLLSGLQLHPGSSMPQPSVAVLPLSNLSENPEHEYFSVGMTEELISHLARNLSLRVISRTSVMRFKNSDLPLPEIADQLGVSHIVEGTVRSAGDRVRITVRLMDARTERPLWAGDYERDVTDILALQNELASAIVQKIGLGMTLPGGVRSASRDGSRQAYDTVLKGAYLLGPVTPNGVTEASTPRGDTKRPG